MAAQNNTQAAEQTYHSFLGVMKWSAVGCALIAALVIALIA
ncbi:MAG: aa3-type cytochrome c oxidase subunit IV [Sphingobium sp.]